MTTATVAALTESQQMLIDARLDTIDRMLLGHVPRADRMTIVGEVEAQIQELLAEKDRLEISREDVLEVLRTLDPPEAYLTDEMSGESLPRQRQVSKLATNVAQQSQPKTKESGWLGGVLGLSSLGVIPLYVAAYLSAIMTGSNLLLLVGFLLASLLGFVSGVAGLVLSIQGRRQGTLPSMGIVGAAVSLLHCVLGMLFTALLFMNM